MVEYDQRPEKNTETRLNLDDLLTRVRYSIDVHQPHIRIDEAMCRNCDPRKCITVCPAGVYNWDGQSMSVRWERCLECGACHLTCDKESLSWQYPRGGRGVSFRIG